MARSYISPSGSGNQDGSSWANAATIGNLSAMIARAAPGGEVLLRSDQGAYELSGIVSVAAAGDAGAPVTIHGVEGDGDARAATFLGTRAENWRPGLESGAEAFRIQAGADHLRFQDLAFENFGNGVFRIRGDIEDLAIEHVDARNVTRFLENNAANPASTATVDGLTLRDIDIRGYSSGAIRLQYDSSRILLEDVRGDSERQDGGLYVVGVHLQGTVHDAVLRRVAMANNYGSGEANEYWNGDGFATEWGVHDIRFEDTVARGNTDAGYDLKSSDTFLLRALAENNNRSFRFWSETIRMDHGASLSPHFFGGSSNTDHVWMGEGAVAHLNAFRFSDAGERVSLFDLWKGGATIHLSATPIAGAYAAMIGYGNGSRVVASTWTPDAGTSGGGAASVNHAPTAMRIDGGAVSENAAAGTVVTRLSVLDRDAGENHRFTIVDAAADCFEIVGNQVRVKPGAKLDFETAPTLSLSIRAIDNGGLFTQAPATVTVNDLREAVTGSTGKDFLKGGPGSDDVNGRAGNDVLDGQAGNDILNGGAGLDTLFGGAGRDSFVFATAPNARKNLDWIRDFRPADDTLVLDNGVLTELGAHGKPKSDALHFGKAAADAEDRVIYDRSTGSLFYDADGTGAAGAVKLAILLNKPILSLSDFLIS